jgi:hypothetical protein
MGDTMWVRQASKCAELSKIQVPIAQHVMKVRKIPPRIFGHLIQGLEATSRLARNGSVRRDVLTEAARRGIWFELSKS